MAGQPPAWQQSTGRGTFVPLYFLPGEAFQFDWSEDFAVLESWVVYPDAGFATTCAQRWIVSDAAKIGSIEKSDACD